MEKNINIRASDYRFSDKMAYYQKSQIYELHNIHGRYSDFAEAEILNRNSEIINGFIGYLAEQGLIA